MMQNVINLTSHVATESPVLDVRGLSVSYGSPGSALHAVRNVSFSIDRGEALGLIGESGSGKTTVAYAVMRHISARSEAERIALNGRDITQLSMRDLRKIRGRSMSMVYQDPMNALNPILTVGEQVAEVVRRHKGVDRAVAWDRVVALFEQVRLPNPRQIGSRYPHQLSGGQQQRVVIAMAIACEPDLLIMDEPTTGLDVTTEAVILDLIADLRKTINSAVLFISHNLSVIADVCDRVGVLYAGQLVEHGTVRQIIRNPRHPYTIGLIGAMPRTDIRQSRLRSIRGRIPDLRKVPSGCIFQARCDLAYADCDRMPELVEIAPGHASRCHLAGSTEALARPEIQVARRAARCSSSGSAGKAPCLAIDGVSKSFQGDFLSRLVFRESPVNAVVTASFEIEAGKTLAVVGESGSGKSTLARCVAGLLSPSGGRISLDGFEVHHAVQRRTREQQRAIQFVFQNPESSLNPFHTVFEIVSRPIRLYESISEGDLRRRVTELLDAVKLSEGYADRYPRELSGGEKQRVCIARAFAAQPRLIICDEPTSALDISVQAAILNQLNDLQDRFGTSYLFISHDLAAVRQVADKIVVMYQGRLLEQGTAEQVLGQPSHPYTEALLAAAARLDTAKTLRLEGPTDAPMQGCVFHPRCPRKVGDICEQHAPAAEGDAEGHVITCHISMDRLALLQAVS